MMMQKITINWEKVNKESCIGCVTLDTWTDEQVSLHKPEEQINIEVYVDNEKIVLQENTLSTELKQKISSMCKHYFSGLINKEKIYEWVQ